MVETQNKKNIQDAFLVAISFSLRANWDKMPMASHKTGKNTVKNHIVILASWTRREFGATTVPGK